MICFSAIESCTLYQSSEHPHRGQEEGQLRTFSQRRHTSDLFRRRHFNRNTKTHQRSPEHEHEHEHNKESQWIPGLNNPCWVQEELYSQRRMQPTEFRGDGQGGMEKQRQKKKMTRRTMHYEVHQEKDGRHGVEKEHRKAQKEKKGRHDVEIKKIKNMLQPRNGSHHKPQQEGKGPHGVESKRKKIMLGLMNGSQYKARQDRNALQSNTQQEDNTLQSNQNHKNVTAKAVSLVASLKACANDKDLHMGSKIHADIITLGLLEKNVFIGSALVNMYAKCGAMEKAQEVFDKLPVQNVVSWTVLIAGYAQHGNFKEALTRFEQMQLEGYSPDAFTFASILKACTSMGAFKKGKEIHALIAREDSLEENIHLGTVLVDMYSKFGALEKAQDVFDKLSVHDAVLWTALIAGYAQHEEGEEALINFERMQLEGFFPDAVTFSCILKACGSIRAAYKGQNIHAQIERHGLLENNMIIGTALVDMYANCGMLAEAQDSFDRLPTRDMVSWSALIAGYAEHGHGEEAMRCFEWMQNEGFTPDAVSFTRILKICGSMGASNRGQEIHAQIVRERMLDTHVGTVLVDMYAKCGVLEKAEEVFGELQVQDVVLWTALIAGYTHHGHDEKALHNFEQMQLKGFSADAVTFASVLKSCGSTGAVHKGQRLHAEIVMHGLLENVETALVDMYAHLGMLAEAQKVFDMLVVRDLVSWTVLIAGYAQLGKDKLVFNLLEKMIGEGTQPDSVTFIAVLNTCSHKGLVDEGQLYFELISRASGIVPTSEHHTCMIDLFGRAGHLEMAIAVIEEMPLSASLTLWHTFLGACQKWGNRKLGSWAFEHALEMDKWNPSPYVSLRNIYSDIGSLEDMGKITPMRSMKANMEETWT